MYTFLEWPGCFLILPDFQEDNNPHNSLLFQHTEQKCAVLYLHGTFSKTPTPLGRVSSPIRWDWTLAQKYHFDGQNLQSYPHFIPYFSVPKQALTSSGGHL